MVMEAFEMTKNYRLQGFTLIEVITALAIVGILLVPILTSFLQASKMSAETKDALQAYNLGRKYMEGILYEKNRRIENPKTIIMESGMQISLEIKNYGESNQLEEVVVSIMKNKNELITLKSLKKIG